LIKETFRSYYGLGAKGFWFRRGGREGEMVMFKSSSRKVVEVYGYSEDKEEVVMFELIGGEKPGEDENTLVRLKTEGWQSYVSATDNKNVYNGVEKRKIGNDNSSRSSNNSGNNSNWGKKKGKSGYLVPMSNIEKQIALKVRESMTAFLSLNSISEHSDADANPFIRSDSPLHTSYSFWSEINVTRNRHHLLSYLALAFLITPASEAPCERTLSRLKFVIADRRGNLKDKTLFHMFVITE
jgi:hypothetical protein